MTMITSLVLGLYYLYNTFTTADIRKCSRASKTFALKPPI